MTLRELRETLDDDEIIGPSLWAFRDDGRNPAAGHVYEVLGMGDFMLDTGSQGVACVVRSRVPIGVASGSPPRAVEHFYMSEQQDRGEGPRAWMVEGYESFVARFEPVILPHAGEAVEVLWGLKRKPWSVFRLP